MHRFLVVDADADDPDDDVAVAGATRMERIYRNRLYTFVDPYLRLLAAFS
jgi:hypothetical protein